LCPPLTGALIVAKKYILSATKCYVGVKIKKYTWLPLLVTFKDISSYALELSSSFT